MAQHLFETATKEGGRPALRMGDAVVTYGEFAHSAGRVAAASAARGATPGDRVGLVLPIAVPSPAVHYGGADGRGGGGPDEPAAHGTGDRLPPAGFRRPARRRDALPCEATLRRCLQATDPAALDAAVAGWAVGQLTAQQALAAGAHVDLVPADPGRRVIAIDGKTLRGSAPRATPEQAAAAARGGGRTHLVAAYDHASRGTPGEVACAPEAGKGGEVAAAKELAATLDDRGLLADSVITVDAGLTARLLAADLRCRGAHWIL